MKTIASQPLLPKVAGEWEALGQLRHPSVESGVETGHLCQAGKAGGYCLDYLDLTGKVQRRKRDQPAQ